TGPPPSAQRLVLILAEGLRPDDARLLPTLDWLAGRGAQLKVTVPQPGYATPSVATLLTGARPEVHGVLFGDTQLRSDNLVAAAKRATFASGGAGRGDMGALFGMTHMDSWAIADTPEDLVKQSQTLLAASGPRLVVLHTDFLAAESRRLHTASRDSADYRNALAQFDFALVRLLDQIDWKTTAVAVAGLVPTNTTGTYAPDAPVPLILAGPGVKAGYRGETSLLDAAPTLSAIAGIPVPLPNEGRPALAALQLTVGRPTDLVLEKVLEARKAYTEGRLAALGSLEKVPDAPVSAGQAETYFEGLEQQVREARFAAWRTWALGLAPYAGGAALLILIYLVVVMRQPFGGAVFAGMLTYVAAFHVIFFLTGGRYSAAMAGLESVGRNTVLLMAGRSAGAMVVTMAVTGYLLSRKGFKKRAYVAGAACHMLLTTAVLMALPVAVVLGRTGWDFPITLPGVGLVVWFFVTGLQVMVIGYLSPLWAAVAISAAALSRKWWPLKEVGDPERNADKVVRMKALRHRTK
ncbi:MAG TPA: hypothetical protein VNT75_07635, partial [Symbiobacteriaceae bacterium]|nr:hypothetical protein [Symbiobacteriaceae bacterium]